ncbi:MAG: 16S rRNA (guanine(527)-N(7))-methyltransferase RsmG [Spirochaetes bacterium]|nr:16S rRNA (guanine(527)-N(7))-methyltransferase RsmG [Spirochaetota bacterium]
MNTELLSKGLVELELPGDGEIAEKLRRYIEAIEAWNPSWGLVGAKGDELIIKHVFDSLAPLAVFDRILTKKTAGTPSLADLGTGAGLPGIPLAIARPGVRVVLIERMTRRIRFLEAMRTELALDNVDIIEEQVEHARGSHDVVTFRAFRPFERKLFRRVFALCAPDGRIVAYKGKAARAAGELAAISELHDGCEILPVRVPFLDDERCVVVMKPARR